MISLKSPFDCGRQCFGVSGADDAAAGWLGFSAYDLAATEP